MELALLKQEVILALKFLTFEIEVLFFREVLNDHPEKFYSSNYYYFFFLIESKVTLEIASYFFIALLNYIYY